MELLDTNTKRKKPCKNYIVLLIGSTLFIGGLIFQIYIIYSMRSQALALQKMYPNEVFFINYDLNFIPLYMISAFAIGTLIWWMKVKGFKTIENWIGFIILLATLCICFIPSEKWFG